MSIAFEKKQIRGHQGIMNFRKSQPSKLTLVPTLNTGGQKSFKSYNATFSH